MRTCATAILGMSALLASGLAMSGTEYQFRHSIVGLVATPQDQASCQSILDTGASQADGIHTINPAGSNPFEVYCDMTTDGGGWTLVVAQFESDPVTNWNKGVPADYDPSLVSSKSFALSMSEIPDHAETAFGKALNPTYVGYSTFTYSTGNISTTAVVNSKSGIIHHIHRNANHYFPRHNPEASAENGSTWNNTLTYDETGGVKLSWAFSPQEPEGRNGYSIDGSALINSLESFPWTVWVR